MARPRSSSAAPRAVACASPSCPVPPAVPVARDRPRGVRSGRPTASGLGRPAAPAAVAAALASPVATVAAGAAGEPTPAADVVVAYDPGAPIPFGFDDPAAALGLPARFSGIGVEPGVVSPFQPAFTPAELVAVGPGGELVVSFDEPVTDDPANPFGVDLLVFGNPLFLDAAFPAGVVGGLFAEGGEIAVSADGTSWTTVPGAAADGGWPTLGWLDAGPYDDEPGRVPSDFTRPVDPSMDPADVAGTSYPELLAMYDGAGGGTPVDLAVLGLSEIAFVRIRLPEDAATAVEVDAVVDVAPAGPPADVNGDGAVDFDDLLAVVAAFGPCPAPPAPCPEDVDGTGAVAFDDLLAVLAAWSGEGA